MIYMGYHELEVDTNYVGSSHDLSEYLSSKIF
jgi:hypothetical protein